MAKAGEFALGFVPFSGVIDVYKGIKSGDKWAIGFGLAAVAFDALTFGGGSLIKGGLKAAFKSLTKSEAKSIVAGALESSVKTLDPNTLLRTERGISWKRSTERVAEYMKKGVNDPVDVFQHNGKSYIIDGHHRVEAAIRLGKNVPVNYLSTPRNYSSIFELQDAAYRASMGNFKVDGRYLQTLLKK